jgi:predicted ATPase with chaperone activity
VGTTSEIAVLGGAAPAFIPPPPRNIADSGLSQSLVEQLILRLLYYRGELTGSEVASGLGLMFSVLEPVLEHFKRSRWIEPKRSSGLGLVSTYVALTEAGRVFARQAVEQCQYSGVAPVPVAQYAAGVLAQRLTGGWLTQEMLHKAFEGLVVSPSVLAQIGPAVSSFSSFLIYGQPGNGKTYLAESLVHLPIPEIYLPYALEANGNLIQVFDPVYHKPQRAAPGSGAVAQDLEADGRWFRTKRPFIVSGGELTLDMLDLAYSSQTKTYDAPLHVKANNGIYLLDDFGRQRISPAEVLNRWIVPMERKVDFLSLRTGGKVTIPFECLLVLSTNLRPSQIGDEAFLRRIRYKMLLRSPDHKEFEEIFRKICAQTGLVFRAEVFDRFLKRKYLDPKKPLRRCHARDLISHAMDYIQFERLPYRLTDDVLDHAYSTTFVDEQGMEDS